MNSESIAQNFESSSLLQQEFHKLKKADKFSLRQWGSLSSLSASYLTLVLNSRRLPTRSTFLRLLEPLALDQLTKSQVMDAHLRDLLRHKDLASDLAHAETQIGKKAEPEVQTIVEDDSSLLKSWLHLAVLEYTTCGIVENDHEKTAAYFGVTREAIKSTVFDLLDSGFLKVNENGVLEKVIHRMRIPSTRSRKLIREFHVQMLKKAIRILESTPSNEEFEERLITGYTVAVDPANLPAAKLMIQKAMIEIATKLATGSAAEVYQLQIQLFPLRSTAKR